MYTPLDILLLHLQVHSSGKRTSTINSINALAMSHTFTTLRLLHYHWVQQQPTTATYERRKMEIHFVWENSAHIVLHISRGTLPRRIIIPSLRRFLQLSMFRMCVRELLTRICIFLSVWCVSQWNLLLCVHNTHILSGAIWRQRIIKHFQRSSQSMLPPTNKTHWFTPTRYKATSAQCVS